MSTSATTLFHTREIGVSTNGPKQRRLGRSTPQAASTDRHSTHKSASAGSRRRSVRLWGEHRQPVRLLWQRQVEGVLYATGFVGAGVHGQPAVDSEGQGGSLFASGGRAYLDERAADLERQAQRIKDFLRRYRRHRASRRTPKRKVS
jgi:hypothetical protein